LSASSTVSTKPKNSLALTWDQTAREAGWLVLRPGEAYEYVFSRGSAVYVLLIDGLWYVWRASWASGEPTPRSEKTLATSRSFEAAFQRAKSYVEWRLKK